MEVVISKGPGYEIEDYTDMLIDDVQNYFLKNNIQMKVDIEYRGMPNTNPGTVLEQSGLLEGDVIDPDDDNTIHFVVAQYPSIIISEDLIGMDVDEAKAYLNDLGIAVMLKQAGTSYNNEVVSVYPAVGTEYIQEGTDSVVTLFYD